jgi:hypothetical protein
VSTYLSEFFRKFLLDPAWESKPKAQLTDIGRWVCYIDNMSIKTDLPFSIVWLNGIFLPKINLISQIS